MTTPNISADAEAWNQRPRPVPRARGRGLYRGAHGQNPCDLQKALQLSHVLEDPQGKMPARLIVDVDSRHRHRLLDVRQGLRMVAEPHALKPPPAPLRAGLYWASLAGLSTSTACLIGAGLLLLLGASPPGAIALAGIGVVGLVGLLALWAVGWSRERKANRKSARYVKALEATLRTLDAAVAAHDLRMSQKAARAAASENT